MIINAHVLGCETYIAQVKQVTRHWFGFLHGETASSCTPRTADEVHTSNRGGISFLGLSHLG